MALSPRDREIVRLHLVSLENLQYIKAELDTNRRALVAAQRQNFLNLQWWLKSMLCVVPDDEGIREVADMIQESRLDGPPVTVLTSPPPALDVAAEVAKVLRECAHAKTIRGIHVQLDIDQMKHQPASVPIGTRVAEGEKFGTFATKAWHETNTMDHMATWAATLAGMVEGRQEYHGQGKRVAIASVGPCCFEGFCVLLGGTKYVSFHCYPNSR